MKPEESEANNTPDLEGQSPGPRSAEFNRSGGDPAAGIDGTRSPAVGSSDPGNADLGGANTVDVDPLNETAHSVRNQQRSALTEGQIRGENAPTNKALGNELSNPNEVANKSSISPINEAALTGYHQIDARFVTAERVVGVIVWLVLFGIACSVGIPLAIAFWPHWILFASLAGAATLLVFIGVCFWVLPVWSYSVTGWRLDQSGFKLRRGIFWREVVAIPRARIQHADVHQGPLMRSMHLAKIIIHTAGTSNASVELNGLAQPVAEELRDKLIEDDGFDND